MLRKGNPVPEVKTSGSMGRGRVLLFMHWSQQLRLRPTPLPPFFLRAWRQLQVSWQYRGKTSFDLLHRPEILFKPNPALTYIVMISVESNFLVMCCYSLEKIEEKGTLPVLFFKHTDECSLLPELSWLQCLTTETPWSPVFWKLQCKSVITHYMRYQLSLLVSLCQGFTFPQWHVLDHQKD